MQEVPFSVTSCEGKKWPWEVINLYDILTEEDAPAVSAASESSSDASHELAAAGASGFAPIFYVGIRFGKLVFTYR